MKNIFDLSQRKSIFRSILGQIISLSQLKKYINIPFWWHESIHPVILRACVNAHLFYLYVWVYECPGCWIQNMKNLREAHLSHSGGSEISKKCAQMSGNPFLEQISVFAETRILKIWQNCFTPIHKKITLLETLSDALNFLKKKLTLVNLSLFFGRFLTFQENSCVLSIWQAIHFGFSLFMAESKKMFLKI